MALRITFHGGAGEVTGSHFLIESAKAKVVVDCGIEQGKDYCASCMYDPFPYDVSSIDALIITHAHLDHIGRVPRLVKEGYKGPIYMTEPTRDLTEVMLRDSAEIMGNNAKRDDTAPLYMQEDVTAVLALIKTVPYRQEIDVAPGLSMYLRDTSHILGSASIRLKDEDGDSLAITSDIGNSPSALLPDSEPIMDAETIVIESVYGDRANPEKAHRVEKLKETLKAAVARGGPVLIPSFSVERTQLLLYELSNLFEAGELPKVPVFLDAPLAISVTEIYRKYASKYFKESAKEELLREHDLFSFPFLTMTRSREESEAIGDVTGPKIIMAGAGMSHGGRIGKWEERYLPDPKATLIMVGYQAPGSPGRLLQDGASHVQIDRRDVRVRAKVETLHGWSGHADRDVLLEFARSCKNAKQFLVAMGEPSSARFLAQRIHDFLGVKAMVVQKGETWEGGKRVEYQPE